jgi:hypothetical protein
MTVSLHFQCYFGANAARAVVRVLFGTAGLSGLSAFATAKASAKRRRDAKVNA